MCWCCAVARRQNEATSVHPFEVLQFRRWDVSVSHLVLRADETKAKKEGKHWGLYTQWWSRVSSVKDTVPRPQLFPPVYNWISWNCTTLFKAFITIMVANISTWNPPPRKTSLHLRALREKITEMWLIGAKFVWSTVFVVFACVLECFSARCNVTGRSDVKSKQQNEKKERPWQIWLRVLFSQAQVNVERKIQQNLRICRCAVVYTGSLPLQFSHHRRKIVALDWKTASLPCVLIQFNFLVIIRLCAAFPPILRAITSLWFICASWAFRWCTTCWQQRRMSVLPAEPTWMAVRELCLMKLQ